MADTIGTAYVQIEPSFDGVTGKIEKEFGGEAEKAGTSSGKKFGSSFAGAIGTAGKVAAGAIAAGTAAVGGFVKASISAGSEYQSAFAQVETIMDTTTVSAEDMSAAIQNLSSDMAISASDLAGTVYNAISATGDTANAVNLAAQASKLATAGFTDTGSALSVLTTAMNSYGLSADKASDISDSLIAVQNLGVTTVSELSASMGKAIASASAYNVNLNNLESAYVSLTKGGINTAESTTYISSMLKELGSEGTKVSDTIKAKTGKSFAELMNEGKTLGDVLQVLSDSVKGDTTALMNLWSSAEAGKASNAIVSQGLEQFNENLLTIQESSGLTESAYETMADTLEHKTELFKTLGTNLLTSVFQGMEGDLSSFVDIGNEALKAISEGFNEGGIDGMMEAVGTALSDILAVIAQKFPELITAGMRLLEALRQGLLQNLPTIASTFFDLIPQIVQSIMSMLPQLLSVGVQIIGELASGIAEALPTLIPMAVEIITQLVQIIIENIPMLVEAAVQIITGLVEGIMQALPILIEALPEIVTNLVNAMLAALPTLIQGIIQLVMMIVQNLPTIIQALVEAIPEIITAIVLALPQSLPALIEGAVQLITALAGAWPEICYALFQAIPDIIAAIVLAFADLGPQLITELGNAFESLGPTFEQIGTYAQEAWNGIKAAFAPAGTWFSNTFKTAVNGVKKAWNSIKTFFEGVWKDIVSVFSNVGEKFMEIGRNIVEGIKNGIAGTWENLKNFLSAACGDLIALAKRILGIGSPSREFANQVGRWIPAGIAEGIQSGMGVLNSEIQKMTDDALVGTITTSTNAINSISYVPETVSAGSSVVINNNIRVDGAQDPEAWTQTFISTLKREARMA